MDCFVVLANFQYLDVGDKILHNTYFKYVLEPFVFLLLLINLPQEDLRANLIAFVN